MKKIIFKSIIIISFSLYSTLFCQADSTSNEINLTINEIRSTPINLSGPRMGVTILSESFRKTIMEKHKVELNPVVAQFGWHFEYRFFSAKNGATAISEWVLLIGGFGQEKFIPSLTWLLGYRSPSGFEFGAGPNLSVSGTSVVFATGITFQSEDINVPVNIALATSKSGLRFTLLFGFNLRRD